MPYTLSFLRNQLRYIAFLVLTRPIIPYRLGTKIFSNSNNFSQIEIDSYRYRYDEYVGDQYEVVGEEEEGQGREPQDSGKGGRAGIKI